MNIFSEKPCRRLPRASAAWIGVLVIHAVSYGGTVEYEITFDASWSSETHPQDFPRNPHFSGLIGGTHADGFQIWAEGLLASPGIERMAELGSKNPLSTEIQQAIQAGDAFSLISGGGIGRSPGTVSERFSINATHPHVTLVSMIAPSPDWFVGVSGLPLREDDRWIQEVVVPLLAYDAGTDSGPRYTSGNEDTDPREPIARISDPPFDNALPLGTFTFRLIPPLMPGDADRDFDVDQQDLIQVQQAGKYGTGQPATWGDGDWNGAPGGNRENPPLGDGVFDQLDVVATLQAGVYLSGPYASIAPALRIGPRDLTAASIPEPSTAVLLAVGGIVLSGVRRLRRLGACPRAG